MASYNIHSAVGADGRRDRRRIVQVLRQLDADIIGLQEVAAHSTGDETLQLDYLAGETGFKAIVGPTMLRRGSDYGNVLLTRHRILDVRSIDLSVPGREPRGAIDADIAIGANTVRVIVTHLGLCGGERRRQVQALAEIRTPGRDNLVIVLSDSNEWHPYGRALFNMRRHFGKSDALRTFPSWLPLFALDRIWVWPERALLETRVHRQAPAHNASDHLPITAKICLQNESAYPI